MADDLTRLETVTANITNIENKYGTEFCSQMQTKCLEDISVSLAMLVDAGTTDNNEA